MTDANAKAKTALEQARQNLEKTAEDLRKSHPDVEKQAGELRNKLQAAVQNTAQVPCNILTSSKRIYQRNIESFKSNNLNQI